MKHNPLPLITFLLLLLSCACLQAGDPARGNLDDLLRQMKSNPAGDFSKFIGKTFEVRGMLEIPKSTPQTVHLELWAFTLVQGRKIDGDSGVACDIIVGDSAKFLHFVSDSIAIMSTGVLQSVDAKRKTITLKSDDKATFVSAAN